MYSYTTTFTLFLIITSIKSKFFFKYKLSFLSYIFLLGHEVQNSSLLLYSTTVDIRYINITSNEKKSHLLYANNKDEIMFDFHYAEKKICWTNHSYECIQCDGFDGYKFENKVIFAYMKINYLYPSFMNCRLKTLLQECYLQMV